MDAQHRSDHDLLSAHPRLLQEMEDRVETPTGEVRRLQRSFADLIDVLALSANQGSNEPSQVLGGVLDSLLEMLNLDLVYARMDAADGDAIEMLRVDPTWQLAPHLKEVGEMVRCCLAGSTQVPSEPMRKIFKDHDLFVFPVRVEMHGAIAALVAVSQRLDFPQQAERLVLRLAATRAVFELREIWFLNQREVEVRTNELAATNEKFKRSEPALREAVDEIQKSEHRLRQVIDTIPTLAWCNLPDGPNEFLNRGWHEYTGLSPEASHGWGWTAAFHPEDLPPLMERWQRMLVSGESDEIEARLRRHDGVFRWFLIRAQAFRDDTGKILRWYGTSTDIEDRKRSEEALNDREQSLRLILDGIAGLVAIMSSSGAVEAVNRRVLDYFGDSIEHLKGWSTSDAVHPNDLPHVIAAWTHSVETAVPYDVDHRLRDANGVYRWFHARGLPLRDAAGRVLRWYVLLTDIDDRRRAEEALQASERELGRIVNTIPALTWSARPDGAAEFFSQHYLAYVAMSLDQLQGSGWAVAVHPDDIGRLYEYWRSTLAAGQPGEIEARLRRFDGVYRWFLFRVSPLRDQSGAIVKWYGTNTDVDDRRRAEEELRNAQSELARVTRVMTMERLTASIAHEVNQPLSGIVTNAGTCLRMLVADPPNVDGAVEVARRAMRDANRASDVIARLRRLYNKKEPILEATDLNETAREVIALLWAEIQRNGVTMRHEFADNLPPALGDRIQLQQVILNLLRNAVEAMSSVDGRPRELLLKTERHAGNQVRLSVRDSGVGFTPQAAERIFQAFYTTKADGMGIGLSISRSIIEAHQGRLWATRNDGAGSTFSFVIPCSSIP